MRPFGFGLSHRAQCSRGSPTSWRGLERHWFLGVNDVSLHGETIFCLAIHLQKVQLFLPFGYCEQTCSEPGCTRISSGPRFHFSWMCT